MISRSRRIGLWIASVLLSVAVFSVCMGFAGSVVAVFSVTVIFALPVALLYLPVVTAIENAARWRKWILLLSGTLVGPIVIAILAGILWLRGGDPDKIWRGDPLTGVGAGSGMILAGFVGGVAALFYVVALAFVHKSNPADKDG